MTTFNFLTGKAYKTNSDIDKALQDAIKARGLTFTGFATITQARKQFIKVKTGAKGVKCPIQIAGGKVRYFYLFAMEDFTTCEDKRSKKAQKAEPNQDQHDRIIRYALPAKMAESEKKKLIDSAHKLTELSQANAIKCHKAQYDTYMYDANVDSDMYKVDVHRTQKAVENLEEQAKSTSFSGGEYGTNQDVLNIDKDAYSNVDAVVC